MKKPLASREAAEQELIVRVGLTLGDAIDALVEQGQSHRSIAKAAGYADQHLREVTSGKANLKLASIARLAHAVGMNVEFRLTPNRVTRQRRVNDIVAQPIRPEKASLHDIIATAVMPSIANGQRGNFRTISVRSILHVLVVHEWEWIRVSELASLCGIGATWMKNALQGLEQAGLLERETRPAKGTARGAALNRYRVIESNLRRLAWHNAMASA